MLKRIKKFRSVKWFGGSDTPNKRWDFNDCASELAIRTRCGQCGMVPHEICDKLYTILGIKETGK